MSDADNTSWAGLLCFAAVAGIENTSGHAVGDGCCCRLGWYTDLFCIGVTFSDHPDDQRSAGFDVGGLLVCLVLHDGGRMLLGSGCCHVVVFIIM